LNKYVLNETLIVHIFGKAASNIQFFYGELAIKTKCKLARNDH